MTIRVVGLLVAVGLGLLGPVSAADRGHRPAPGRCGPGRALPERAAGRPARRVHRAGHASRRWRRRRAHHRAVRHRRRRRRRRGADRPQADRARRGPPAPGPTSEAAVVRLATWNVNSLKARQDRVEEWLGYADADVVCLQETKLSDDTFPQLAFGALGYDAVHHGQGQWNGVAILSRVGISDVTSGFEGTSLVDPYAGDARLLAATCGGVRVVNVYVPNGREVGSEYYTRKLDWLGALRAWLDATASPHGPARRARRLQRGARGPRRVVTGRVRGRHPRHRARARRGRRAGGVGPRRRVPGRVPPGPAVLVLGLPARRLPRAPRHAHRPRPRHRSPRPHGCAGRSSTATPARANCRRTTPRSSSTSPTDTTTGSLRPATRVAVRLRGGNRAAGRPRPCRGGTRGRRRAARSCGAPRSPAWRSVWSPTVVLTSSRRDPASGAVADLDDAARLGEHQLGAVGERPQVADLGVRRRPGGQHPGLLGVGEEGSAGTAKRGLLGVGEVLDARVPAAGPHRPSGRAGTRAARPGPAGPRREPRAPATPSARIRVSAARGP